MSAATLRYDRPPNAVATPAKALLQRAKGEAELVFGTRGARTVLRHLHQRTPCRILFPDAEADEPKLAVLLTTSGGLTGGDEIRIRVEVESGATATVTSQAA
jgi:urease accessory protein